MTDLVPHVETKPRRQAFAELLARVWLCFPRSGMVDAHQIESYWLVLQVVPIGVLREVAQRILERRPAPDCVPSAPEWLEVANTVGAELVMQQRDDLKALPLPKQGYHCDTCQDTGWRPSTTQSKAVTACECRPTNPIYQQTRTTAPRYRIPRRTHAPTQEGRDGRTRSSGDDD